MNNTSQQCICDDEEWSQIPCTIQRDRVRNIVPSAIPGKPARYAWDPPCVEEDRDNDGECHTTEWDEDAIIHN